MAQNKLETVQQNELEMVQAWRLALFHDNMRENVTKSLRWALDTLDLYKDRLPKDEVLARAFDQARKNLATSEAVTAAIPH